MKKYLITGCAGFIGSNLVLELLRTTEPVHIIGIDNINDYYDVSIKEYRLRKIEEEVQKHTASSWNFIKGSIADKTLIDQIFTEYKPTVVVNLAAQAGVRYSITNPDVYIESNLIGFYNILEACRHSYDAAACDDSYHGVEHLIYASSSSVYGSNKKIPYSTDDKVDNPVSLYAATKKSNELMAHATVSFIIFHPQDSASSPYTDLPEDRIWHTLDSQTNYVPEKQFKSLIMETANETLHLSMIL